METRDIKMTVEGAIQRAEHRWIYYQLRLEGAEEEAAWEKARQLQLEARLREEVEADQRLQQESDQSVLTGLLRQAAQPHRVRAGVEYDLMWRAQEGQELLSRCEGYGLGHATGTCFTLSAHGLKALGGRL